MLLSRDRKEALCGIVSQLHSERWRRYDEVGTPVVFRKQTKPLLWIGFGGLLLLMSVLGVSSVSFLYQIDSRHERIRQDFVVRNRILENLRSDLYLSGTNIRDYLIDSDDASAKSHERAYFETKERIQEATAKYGQFLRDVEVDSFRTLREELQSYLETLEEVFHWDAAERRARGDTFVQERVMPKRLAMVTLADHIERVNEKHLEASSQETSELFSVFRIRLIALAVLMLTLGIALAGLSLRRTLQLERESEARFEEIVRARRELQDLSARVLSAQESERRRIARELHDDVGQVLWALSLSIDNLGAVLKCGDTEAALREVAGIREISNNSVRAVRNMSLLLRPSMLDDLGLLPALKWLAREVSRESDVQVDVTDEAIPEDLPEEHKTCVYRVAQEALRNCCRHAQAGHARIHVRTLANRLILSVQDDGIGFDPLREKGLGLLGMEERVSYLGGSFEVDSRPGFGTIISLRVPLPNNFT